MTHEQKLQRAIDFLKGNTVKRPHSRFWKDIPVKRGMFDVPVSASQMQGIVSGFFGRRLAE